MLHSCCAPCSSYVLEYLSAFFHITVFYFNPNISPREEYEKRVLEQQRLIGEMKLPRPVSFLEGAYHPEDFFCHGKGDGRTAGEGRAVLSLLPSASAGNGTDCGTEWF